MKNLICFVTLVCSVLVVGVADLMAANLNINDLVEGQITLLHDGNWEGGVNSNGTAYAAFAAGVEVVPGEAATFTGSWIAPGLGSPGLAGVLYFVDASNTNIVSDIITASWVNGGTGALSSIAINIQSSTSGADLGPLPATFAGLGIVETGATQGINGLFLDPATAAPVSIPSNLSIQFGSSEVPEPTTLALAGLGLLGVACVRRRRP